MSIWVTEHVFVSVYIFSNEFCVKVSDIFKLTEPKLLALFNHYRSGKGVKKH